MVQAPTGARRRSTRTAAAALVALSMLAAACGDKKDDATAAPGDDAVEVAADKDKPGDPGPVGPPTTDEPVITEAPKSTFEPVAGGTLVIGVESDANNGWTPAGTTCDPMCEFRMHAIYDTLTVIDSDLQVQPYLAASVTPNDDFSEYTITVRDGVTFHDGTPVDADAVMDNLDRNFTSFLLATFAKDVAKNPDGTVKFEKVDDMTFTVFMARDGDPAQPMSWQRFPEFLATRSGFIASPTWLAAVDEDPNLATQAVGSGPFEMAGYAPGDRMTLVRNDSYWLDDENGEALPYLDGVEFRLIADSAVRGQALASGDIDMLSTSDSKVTAGFDGDEAFDVLRQTQFGDTSYVMLHLTVPGLDDRDVRCALAQAVDQQQLIDIVADGRVAPANAPFSPGQEGYLAENGAVGYDPAAATTTIAAWEAANGPLTINFITTAVSSNLTVSQFYADAWGAVGVDVTVDQVDQATLINKAIFGDPAFQAMGWRHNAGIYVDEQYTWWHSSASKPDGELSLNFMRLQDPVIDELLDQQRTELDPEVRRSLAEDINRRFAEQCYVIPGSYSEWGIVSTSRVENVGRTPLPDGDGFLYDGTHPGQIWLTSVFLAD